MTRVQGLFSKTVNSKSKITTIKAKNDDMFLLVYYPETAQSRKKISYKISGNSNYSLFMQCFGFSMRSMF